jgi:hypothetical protein
MAPPRRGCNPNRFPVRILLESGGCRLNLQPARGAGQRSQIRTFQRHSLATPQFVLDSISPLNRGEMAEWLKAHAWKACIPQGIQGSNPCLSANFLLSPQKINSLGAKYHRIIRYIRPENSGGNAPFGIFRSYGARFGYHGYHLGESPKARSDSSAAVADRLWREHERCPPQFPALPYLVWVNNPKLSLFHLGLHTSTHSAALSWRRRWHRARPAPSDRLGNEAWHRPRWPGTFPSPSASPPCGRSRPAFCVARCLPPR